MAVSTDPLDIAKRLLRKDARFKKFRDLVSADDRLRIPIDEWRQEARLIHGGRTVKKLSEKSPNFARNLVKAQANETAARGRFTEMLVQTNTVHRKLKQHLESLEDWLTVEYSYEVSQVCKTAKERESLISNTLRTYIKLTDDTENFLQELNYYIKDIDQAGYGIRAMADVFGAIFKAEGRVDL